MKGSSEAKKPKGALVAVAFGAPRSKPVGGGGDEYDKDPSNFGSSKEAAFAAFANAINIGEGDRPRALEALSTFIYACMRGKGLMNEEPDGDE